MKLVRYIIEILDEHYRVNSNRIDIEKEIKILFDSESLYVKPTLSTKLVIATEKVGIAEIEIIGKRAQVLVNSGLQERFFEEIFEKLHKHKESLVFF